MYKMAKDKDIDDMMDDIERRIGNMDNFDAMISDLENNANLADLSESFGVDEKFENDIARMEGKWIDMESLGQPIPDSEFENMMESDDIEFKSKKTSKRISKGSCSKNHKEGIISGKEKEEPVVIFAGKKATKANIFRSLKDYGKKGERKEPKAITELGGEEAFRFLMESEQYCRTELPIYFDFSGVLKYAKEAVGDRTLRECTVKGFSPDNLDNVNLELITNKDGKYGVRPLTLANPFLYYMLARDICSGASWKNIQKCFSLFKDEHIAACAIPMVKMDDRPEAFRGSTAVLNWWNSMEQTSIELSLKYRYMFVTDITNCFGQINPESIGWALSLKDTDYETTDNDNLAKNIREYLSAMQHGRNIGIPQGSTLFSLIAEIILGYSDLLFAKEVHMAQSRKELPENLDYHVLRYVDDYRIFCSDKEALEKLSYILQGVLERFNFRMNTSKTKISSSIISDSVKPDKMFYIFNTPIESKQTYTGGDEKPSRRHTYDFDSFQKHLLFIYEFSRRFPNSGQLKNQLSSFSRRLENFLSGEQSNIVRSIGREEKKSKEENHKKETHLYENRPVMIAIATEIAADNVSAAHYALKAASQILADMPKTDTEKKKEVIRLMYDKLRHQPNSAFTQVWLQNITHTSDDWSLDDKTYDMPLCRLVAEQPETLWNNTWMKKKIAAGLPIDSIVNRDVLAETGQIIAFKESNGYDRCY